ncbi:MAG: hypothetical protein HY897_14895 [Deltaproteobacteria bacterium]|nr:hypothetical protein [Deltaproteobacteria bacterium]
MGDKIKAGEARLRFDAAYTHDWTGNVRELKNVVSVAMNRAKGGRIDARDLKFESAGLNERVAHGRVSAPGRTMEEIEREVIEDAIERHGGDKRAAANELGIGHTTIKDKLRAWEQRRVSGKE